MNDSSRNHIKYLKERLADLEKILALNEKSIIDYGDLMTEEAKGIIRSQNAIVTLEIETIKNELGV